MSDMVTFPRFLMQNFGLAIKHTDSITKREELSTTMEELHNNNN